MLVAFVPMDLEPPSAVDLLSLLLHAVSLIGLWGFIQSKYFLNRWLWLIIAVLGIFVTAWGVSSAIVADQEHTKFHLSLGLLFAPLYYGLFRYTLSKQWQHDNITSH